MLASLSEDEKEILFNVIEGNVLEPRLAVDWSSASRQHGKGQRLVNKAVLKDSGYTALMCSCRNGHDQCARALLEAGANPNIESNQCLTALNLACRHGHEDCALILLRFGARADMVDDWGDSPRSIAQKKMMKKVLTMMSSKKVLCLK